MVEYFQAVEAVQEQRQEDGNTLGSQSTGWGLLGRVMRAEMKVGSRVKSFLHSACQLIKYILSQESF